jgi:hypothetical protein
MKAPIPHPVYPGLPPRRAQSFTAVALLLTNGNPPPEWLIPELEQNSSLISYHRKAERGDEDEDRTLLAAVKALEQRLVWEVHVHDVIEKKWPRLQAPYILDETATKLFELAEYLESQLRPPRGGGPTPDSRKRVCAGVCADAWHRLHGVIQPYSPKLQAACEEYWQTCGHPRTSTTGRLKNWEPLLEWARDADDEGATTS